MAEPNIDAPAPPVPTPAPTPAPPPPADAAPPPAAVTVLTGDRTEREVDLEKELAEERARHDRTADEKKAREIRVAELEDELHRLKEAAAPPRAKVERNVFSDYFYGAD